MKQPPKFNLERSFARFKEEVIAWSKITSIDKKLRGTLVTLQSLPDSGKYGDLRGKVIDSVKHGGDTETNAAGEVVEKDNGLDLVLAFLEEHLGGDEVTNICEKIRAFMDLKRSPGQSVREYVSDFEHAYTVAQSKAELQELPAKYLMYTLIRNAGISEQDEKLILSGIDLKDNATIYKNTKLALIKYCGENKSAPGVAGVQIASDGTYWQGTGGRGRGKFQGRYPPRRPQPPVDKNFDPMKYHPQIQRDNMDTAGKRINPKKNGKVMTCDFCGSFLHLQARCWEKKQHKVGTYAAMDGQFDDDGDYEDGDEEYETGLEDLEDDEITEESETFLAEHLGALGLNRARDMTKTKYVHYVEDYHQTFAVFEVNVTYDTFHAEDDNKKKVLLDTGCVRTVCGQMWLAHVMKDMDPRIKDTVQAVPSPHIFKFGGGEKLPSLRTIKIPCSINGRNVYLKTEVVDSDIPCLLSKKSMKSARVKIDLENDLINIFGQDVQLITSSTGHYLMEIGDFKMQEDEINQEVDEAVVLITDFAGMEDDEVFKKLKHMHKCLGHPSRRVFERMIQNSSFKNVKPALVNKLYESCEFCFKHRKSKPLPKVSPPMASDFNHTVCMDLKIWARTGKVILYIIDMFSRFTVAKVIPDKRPESVIKVLVNEWIFKWGSMVRLFTDNGGEFVNKKMQSICESYSIKFMNSAARSPFQAGLVESNHKQVDHMIRDPHGRGPRPQV